MSVRYELWWGGERIARYKTLSQALLGALWRARKLQRSVAVYRGEKYVANISV